MLENTESMVSATIIVEISRFYAVILSQEINPR
jgi:hypothetical protein